MSNPYATTTDLAGYMPASVLAGIATEKQQDALDASASEAQGYLRARFNFPLVSSGKDLIRHVCHMAAYDLLSGRGFNPEAGSNVNYRLRHEDAISWLTKVSKGSITPNGMVGSPTAVDPDTNTIAASPGISDDGRSFTVNTNGTPRGW